MNFATPEEARNTTSLKIVYTLNVIICSINIVFDYYFVKATVKHKSLHTPCLILISFYFLCQLLWSTSVFIPFVIVILPSAILDSITIRTCAIVNLIPTAASFGISTLAFVISFDRLLSVYFPLWYSMRLSIKWHIFFLTILSAAIPLNVSIVIIQNGIKYGNLQTICTMADMLSDQLGSLGLFVSYTNSGAVICYLAIFAKLFWKRIFKKPQQNNSRIISTTDLQVLKAVGLILGVQIVIWIIATVFFRIFLKGPRSNAEDKIGLLKSQIILNCINFTIYAVEVPILYFTSSLHRAALQKELKWLEKLFRKDNQVQNLIMVTCPKCSLFMLCGLDLNPNSCSRFISPDICFITSRFSLANQSWPDSQLSVPAQSYSPSCPVEPPLL